MSDPPTSSQGEVSHPQDHEGALEPPKLGGVGDPLTISNESVEGLPPLGDHTVAEGAEAHE